MTEAREQRRVPRTVLVVDHHPAICVTLAYRLEFRGYRVLTAESGAAAIQVAANENIDGALIDVQMPVLSGFDTCLRLQAHSRSLGRVLHVWFMTGAFTPEVERQGMALGAWGVMIKPLDHVRLLSELDRVLPAPGLPSAATGPAGENSQ